MSMTSEIKTLLLSIPNVYIGNMPSEPPNSVGIYNSGGYPRGLTESQLEQPTFMIRVRNVSYATGESLCNTIADILNANSTSTVLGIYQQGGINDLGRDQNSRNEFSINFRAFYKR